MNRQSLPVSGADYEVKLDRRVRMPMSDGVELAAVVARPDAPGEFPAIVEYHPYRRLTRIEAGVSESGYDHRRHGPAWFARRGYAVVCFDVRGTGNSGGSSIDIYSQRERRDGYEAVEWVAAQPWCSGAVGMWGMSYGGVVQWQVAAQRPPHLRTLVMGSSNTDVYLDWTHPGGSIRPYMFDSYSPLMAAYNFAPPDAEIAGPLWEELWQERLENNVPWGIGYISHPLQGPYWKERSLQPDYGRIEVPVLFWCGWADPYPTPILRAFSRARGPQKDPARSMGPLLAGRRAARSPDRLPPRDAEVVRPLAEGGGDRGHGRAGGLPVRAPLQGAGGAHVLGGRRVLEIGGGVAAVEKPGDPLLLSTRRRARPRGAGLRAFRQRARLQPGGRHHRRHLLGRRHHALGHAGRPAARRGPVADLDHSAAGGGSRGNRQSRGGAARFLQRRRPRTST